MLIIKLKFSLTMANMAPPFSMVAQRTGKHNCQAHMYTPM